MDKQLGETMEIINIKHLYRDVKIPVTPFIIGVVMGEDIKETTAFTAVIGDIPCVGYAVPDPHNYWLGYIAKLPGLELNKPFNGWTFEGPNQVVNEIAGIEPPLGWLGFDLHHPMFIFTDHLTNFHALQFLVSELYDSIMW
jgi:hypothetical protein